MRVKHFGKMGDVVSCMAAMKRLRELTGEPVDVVLDDYYLPPQAMAALKPLLESQEDIATVEPAAGQDCDVNFMNWMAEYDHHRNAVLSALEWVVDQEEIEIPLDDPARPWLTIDAPENGLTLVNWTGRHLNAEEEKQVNWTELLDQHPGARFIGLAGEHAAFCEKFQRHVPHEVTADLREAAQLIKGCELYMGNQSAPLAIAHGLGKRVIVESAEQNPNCIFIGRGSVYHGVPPEMIAAYGVPC